MPITSIISGGTQGPGTEKSYRALERAVPQDLPIGRPGETGKTESAGRPLQPDFLQMVKTFVGDVNDMQMRSGRAVDAFVAGEVTDVHQVMVAVQEAGLALDLLLEVRNRTVEAFQEVMRMQI